jgi:hypothetical protein
MQMQMQPPRRTARGGAAQGNNTLASRTRRSKGRQALAPQATQGGREALLVLRAWHHVLPCALRHGQGSHQRQGDDEEDELVPVHTVDGRM